MFDDEKIKIIETMENGYEYITIWVKLLCMAGKKNDDGSIYLVKELPLDQVMLAKIFGHNTDVFKSAINLFQGLGMIDIFDNGHIGLTNWTKYQDKLKSYDDVREQNRLRQEKRRQNNKISQEIVSRDMSRDVTLQEGEENKEENKEEEREPSPSNSLPDNSELYTNGTKEPSPSKPSLPPLPPKNGNLSKMKLGIKKVLSKMDDFDELVNSRDLSIVDIMNEFSEYWIVGCGRDWNPQNSKGLQSSFRKWIGFSGKDKLEEKESFNALANTSKLNFLLNNIKSKVKVFNASQRQDISDFIENFEESSILEIASSYSKGPEDGYDALIIFMQSQIRKDKLKNNR
jgi:predicted phage replisome organizer